MADEVERFAARWFKNKPVQSLLVMAGASGVGKSHSLDVIHKFSRMAAQASFDAKHWEDHIPSSLFVRWPEVVDGFKSGLYGVLDDCIDVDLLCIDDIGAEHDPSRNGVDKLCQVLSRRERRFTAVTTNIEPASWAERFDIRVNDRLLRNSVVLDLSGVRSYQAR